MISLSFEKGCPADLVGRLFCACVPFGVPFWKSAVFGVFAKSLEKYREQKKKNGKQLVSALKSWS